MSKIPVILALCICCAWSPAAEGPSWREQQAERLEGGDLRWSPRAVPVVLGDSARYIDYEGGDDAADGTSPETAWRHHPWDSRAGGRARAGGGVRSYVFKGGVAYRGELVADDSGSADEPIRLTSDPEWGEGPALILGSTAVTDGWSRVDPAAAPADLPQADRVWVRDVAGMEPITALWIGGDEAQRIPLARHPNWTVDDPEDVMAGWAVWQDDEPTKAERQNFPQPVLGADRTWMIDAELLTAEGENAYAGATVWTEHAGLMGSPYPQPADDYDPSRHAIRIGAPWTGNRRPIAGCRYFLENHPRFLDAPGEYWHDVEAGKLYLRLPGDADPNAVAIELAQRTTQITIRDRSHIRIERLEFRHQRVPQIFQRFWDLPDEDPAGIKILGSCEGIHVRGNRFADVVRAVWVAGQSHDSRMEDIVIADNEILRCDYDAIQVLAGGTNKAKDVMGHLGRVQILRNRVHEIGARPRRADHGHAIQVHYADLLTIAGNIVSRTHGAGIFVFGGKPSGAKVSDELTRILIFQNRVDHSCMSSNDWGGIETWQGGPAYVFDNVSLDPVGRWACIDSVTNENWDEWNRRMDQRYPYQVYNQLTPVRAVAGHWNRGQRNANSAGFAYAYYCDGAFKQYHFNNIGQGRVSDPSSPLCSTGGMHAVGGAFLLHFVNNTFHRFGAGFVRKGTYPGPDLFLGNTFVDIGDIALEHAAPREHPKEDADTLPNADPESGAAGSDSQSLMQAWVGNVFRDIGLGFGVLERSGRIIQDPADFAATAEAHWALASDPGRLVEEPLLRDPAGGDFRPVPGSPAESAPVKAFVPWGLAATVGEWQFRLVPQEPWRVPGEHWYMTPDHRGRGMYRRLPRHELRAVGVDADDYVAGPSESWTRSALRLDGEAQHLLLRDADLRSDIVWKDKGKEQRIPGSERVTLDMDQNDILIEVLLRVDGDRDGGLIAGKWGADGWRLVLDQRLRPVLEIGLGGEIVYRAIAQRGLRDGEWQHLLVEFDRDQGVRCHLEGQVLELTTEGSLPSSEVSLANSGDFIAGQGLAASFDFLRVCRATLAGARTDIDELRAWQFDGPFLRTWWGATIEE